MSLREHWEKAYLTNPPEKLGWHKPHLETSTKWIRELAGKDANIIDVGGGASTFAPEAPPKCSGLPVERYSADKLERVLGSEFELKRHDMELHITPGGVEQMYVYCHFQRAAQPSAPAGGPLAALANPAVVFSL